MRRSDSKVMCVRCADTKLKLLIYFPISWALDFFASAPIPDLPLSLDLDKVKDNHGSEISLVKEFRLFDTKPYPSSIS